MSEPETQPETQPPSHAHAEQLLREGNHSPRKIVQVNPDSILFLDDKGKAKTAWLYVAEGKMRICTEPGFAAWPATALHLPASEPVIVNDDIDGA